MRIATAAVVFVSTLAIAKDPCDALIERPPVDPLSCECFRDFGTVEDVEHHKALLTAWLERDPDNPWLHAALGGHLLLREGPRSREELNRALTTFVASRQRTGEAYVHLLQAWDFASRGKTDDVSREMSAAEPIVRDAHDPVLTTWLAEEQAGGLWFASRYEDALMIGRQAMLDPSFDSLPDSVRQPLLRDMANSAQETGRYSEALVFARRAEEACRFTPGCQASYAGTVAEIAQAMAEAGVGTRADAAERTKEAYDAARAAKHPWSEISALCALGGLTDPPESLTWDRLCIERASTAECLDMRLTARLREAEGTARGDPSKLTTSIGAVEQLIREARRSPNAQDPASFPATLASLHEAAGHRDEAIAAMTAAIDLRERMRDRESDPDSRAEVLARSAPYYYRLAAYLALATKGGDVPGAFATMEALRGRTLLDDRAVAAGAGPTAAAGPDTEALARTVQEIAGVQSQLGNAALADEESAALLDQLDRLEAKEQELAAAVARANPAWAEARRPHLAELADVRRRLRDDEALIALQLPPPRVADAWALVVTRSGDRVVRLTAFDAGSATSLYLGAIERRTEPPAGMAAALQAALLAPVLDGLPEAVRRLVIIPDGPVARLPLAALPDPRNGRPLVLRFDLSLVPSATSWLALRDSGETPLAPAALGMGDVTWSEGAEGKDAVRASVLTDERLALPRSRDEVRTMVEAVGGGSRALFASRASEASLKRLDLAPFGIVHFATHAVVNELHPSRSAILLAPGNSHEDGLLQPREIAVMRFDGKLVVLSACSSADGRELRGEGALSLARAFLGAGARAVIGTIWPVRDAEAAALSERFYARLSQGDAASVALASAQRELLAMGANPAAWAGFVLFGDGDATLAPRAAHASPAAGDLLWTPILAGAAVAVALFAWLILRKR